MFTIPHYSTETILRDQFGNNAFDYQLRSETHPDPYLRIAPLATTNSLSQALSQLAFTNLPTFEVVEDGRYRSFGGLKQFILSPHPHRPSTPIFIFDNHNHAFYFWHLSKLHQKTTTPFTLIHIDQHKDSRIPTSFLTPAEATNPDLLYTYTNEILNVGNFIPPALKTGLIDQVINIDSSTATEEILHNNNPLPSPYILDLDLDFFSAEMEYIDHGKKIATIQKLLPQASIITIATSPFFLDQTKALPLLGEIWQKDL